MEEALNAKLLSEGRERVWFTNRLRPLRDAADEAQPELFGPTCDAGTCFT